MNYMILKKFGPHNKTCDEASKGEICKNWEDFAKWSGLELCKEYYSLDGLTRTRMFNPETEEDWQNCINDDFKIDIITNLEYALKVIHKYPDSEIVGVIEEPVSKFFDVPAGHILVGYDILDGYNDVSLLTNWGGNDCMAKIKLNDLALLDSLEEAYTLAERLRKDFATDPHACNCQVWAVYKVS
jgi:hypothetical protein